MNSELTEMEERPTTEENKFIGFDLRHLIEVIDQDEIDFLVHLNEKVIAERAADGLKPRQAFIVSEDMPWFAAVRVLIDGFKESEISVMTCLQKHMDMLNNPPTKDGSENE